MPTTFGKTTPPSPTSGAGAQNPMGRPSPETDAARRRARQGIREYELIWLLQQRLRAVCSVLASLAFALHAATAWPRHGRWELSDLDHSTLSCGDPSACHARFMCSAPAFCAWRRLPLICLKLLVGVCVRDGLAASVCVCRTSAASVELRPRGWRAIAFPCWLHAQSCSTWLIVIVRCCFIWRLVCTRRACYLCF